MIIKSIVVVHRYVGVVLGLIMTLWCLSGFVMMYQAFPFTTGEERNAGLEPLDLTRCCATLPVADDATGFSFRAEMLNGAPVLRMFGMEGAKSYDLSTGQEVATLSEADVKRAAETYATGNGVKGKIKELGTLKIDQWSVQGAARWQPLWRAVFNDEASSWLYVDGKTGEIVQDVNGHERFWSWLGAIPHFLYPTILRQNQPLWSQVVIWASAIGCFLVVTGIFIGVVKLRSKSGKWFPYKRPMWLLHHVFGTFAGILVLTWTFSGLMTMSPWGLLESKGAVSREDLSEPMKWADVRATIDQVKAAAPANVKSLRSAPLLGKPHMIAHESSGAELRFGPNGAAPLQQAELETGLAAKGGLLAAGKLEVLTKEDDYYYGLKRPADLPVYRVMLSDPDTTRIYFDSKTGELSQLADGTGQRYRWLLNAMHDIDLSFMRSRPMWDIIVMILLAAVTAACATGAWLSFMRVGRDAGSLWRLVRRK
jgi:uncharacterized iron-regulated membrane protein